MNAPRILLVDDMRDVRLLYERRLEREGFRVETASSGNEAIGKLGHGHGFHLVITDLNMPDGDGRDLVEHIRDSSHNQLLPVLMFTDTDDQLHVNANLAAGASDYVVKGADRVEFIARVRNLARNGLLQEELERVSRTDELTQLANRRHGTLRLDEEIARSRRYERGLAVALMDVDHFKKVNDTHGHQAGDEVLVAVSRQLAEASRDSDCVIRWGGEEFLFVLPETELDDAAGIVERFRSSVSASPVTVLDGEKELAVSMSGGVAVLEDGDSLETLVARADAALYRAKETGRDRLLLAVEGELVPVVEGSVGS